MSSRFKLLLPVALTILLALSSAQNVLAAVLDQKQETYDWSAGIKGHYPMGQEFVPSLNTLHSVELHISQENPGGDMLTVNIRSGSIGGPILVTASVWASGISGWVSFAWSPVGVTIGATYVIELIAATPGILTWLVEDSGNPYPAGRLILLGVPQVGMDATFRTYGSTSTSVGGVALPTSNLTMLASYLALIGLVATAAVAIKRRRN